jgi:hypothetical protein
LRGSAARPLAARAQQGDRMRRIGVLNTLAADDQEGNRRVAAFLKALQPLGWTIGRNVEMEQRWGSGDSAGLRKNAQELVALAPDVILTIGAAGVAPLLQATRSVPIVFVLVADPVGAGFVDSLAHPGGNATGFMAVEYGFSGKWLELLDFFDEAEQATKPEIKQANLKAARTFVDCVFDKYPGGFSWPKQVISSSDLRDRIAKLWVDMQ